MNRLLFGLLLLLGIGCVIWGMMRGCTVYTTIPTQYGLVEIVGETCQEGLPHTTSAHTIRMTHKDFYGPKKEKILLHESIHLHQRKNPQKWKDFYETVWNYKIHSTAHVPSVAYRPNPDTEDTPFATWKDRYTFIPVYTQDGSLKNAIVKIYDTHTKNYVDIPSEWKGEFCGAKCPHQYEHPHELAAEYITEGSTSPAAQKLYAWWKKNGA